MGSFEPSLTYRARARNSNKNKSVIHSITTRSERAKNNSNINAQREDAQCEMHPAVEAALCLWEMDPKSNQTVTMSAAPSRRRRCSRLGAAAAAAATAAASAAAFVFVFSVSQDSVFFCCCFAFLFAYGASFRKWFVLSGRRRGHCVAAPLLRSSWLCRPGHAAFITYAVYRFCCCEYRIKLQFAFICRVESETKGQFKWARN